MARHTKTKNAPLPDSDLLIRVRKVLHRRRGISENHMFGGTCFFVNGNMIGGVTGKEELVIRVGPDRYEECLDQPFARPMDFTKRPMRGFVYVDHPGHRSDADLRDWLDRGVRHARSLPPKKKTSS
ncbi:MAG: TfoX/Sxy family protein [Planctomycetota bacterium]|nr:TfoX/Sxy family protein [Planctomycetota bacterium]